MHPLVQMTFPHAFMLVNLYPQLFLLPPFLFNSYLIFSGNAHPSLRITRLKTVHRPISSYLAPFHLSDQRFRKVVPKNT